MIRSMAGLTVRVTINTLFYEGSGRRAEPTPFTIPIPTITITPTVIQRAGMCAKCAPIANPTIRMQKPTMYKPKDIYHPASTEHVTGRCKCDRPPGLSLFEPELLPSEATGQEAYRTTIRP